MWKPSPTENAMVTFQIFKILHWGGSDIGQELRHSQFYALVSFDISSHLFYLSGKSKVVWSVKSYKRENYFVYIFGKWKHFKMGFIGFTCSLDS